MRSSRGVLEQPAHEVVGDAVCLPGADDVGEAEHGGVDGEHVGVGGEHRLAGELAGPVGGDGDQRPGLLVEHLLPAIAVDAGSGGVGDARDAVDAGGLDRVVGEVGALPEVDPGVLDGGGDVGVGGEEVDVVGAAHRLDGLLELLEVRFDQPQPGVLEHPVEVGDVPGDEIVEHHDLLAGTAQELAGEMAADEPGATGDEEATHTTASYGWLEVEAGGRDPRRAPARRKRAHRAKRGGGDARGGVSRALPTAPSDGAELRRQALHFV